MTRRLGKGVARHDVRTLKLADYVTSSLSSPPATCDWTKRVSTWGMYENDSVGDCTIAAGLNMIRCWTANGQLTQVGLPDQLALDVYSSLSGYTPTDPTTDTGLVELDVLKYWKAQGLGGHKILAFVSINPFNTNEVKLATSLFGGVYTGLQLPLAWQNEMPLWNVVTGPSGEPGSWGGHCVPIVAYSANGPTVITWGAPQDMTWTAWTRYSDEAWGILSSDFLNQDQAPNGFNLEQLQHDLMELPPGPSGPAS